MSTTIEIKETVEQQLLKIPGVTGVGIGRNSPESINVYLKSACPKITCNIPDEIGGVPVKQIVTGKVMSLAQMQPQVLTISRIARERPYYAGMSVSSLGVSAGTLGVKCYDKNTREVLILTNNHIGANETSIQNRTADVGSVLLQPGVYDGGTPFDTISGLVRVIDFDEEGENELDMVLHRPIHPEDFADSILEIGNVTEIGEVDIGDVVQKSGRSSGLNESTVVDVNATIKVDFENKKELKFRNQIVITPAIGLGGDSGSLVVRKKDKKGVGLLFAGSDSITLANSLTIGAQALQFDLGSPAPLPGQKQTNNFWGSVVALSVPFVFIIKKKAKRNR